MQETQYFCSKCRTIFDNLNTSSQILCLEPCPTCGISLEQNLQKTVKTYQKPLFVKASNISKITLDIERLDSILPFLSLNQIVAIVGADSQKIIERLCIRSQLSERYGGFGAKAVVIDCGNSTDVYLCVSFARKYGLDPGESLSKIITARAFTIHQITSLVGQLPEIISEHQSKLVIISDLLSMFSDPHLDKKELKKILSNIMSTLSKIRDCLVVISISGDTKFDHLGFKNISKLIQITKGYHQLEVRIGEAKQIIGELDLVR